MQKALNYLLVLSILAASNPASADPDVDDREGERVTTEAGSIVTTRYATSPGDRYGVPPEDLAPYREYSADDPLGPFDLERAASFADDVATKWGKKHGCVTCHTNGHYLIAPPEIFRDRPAAADVRRFAEDWIASWDEAGLPATEIVIAPAAFLAINNMQMDGTLRPGST